MFPSKCPGAGNLKNSLPLPLQVASLSGKAAEIPAASDQNVAKSFNTSNPFVSDTFQQQESGDDIMILIDGQ